MHLQCICHACAMQLPCRCHAFAVHLLFICYAVAMQWPCICYALAMHLPESGHVVFGLATAPTARFAVQLTRSWHALCMQLPCICNAFAMPLPCCFAMHLLCTCMHLQCNGNAVAARLRMQDAVHVRSFFRTALRYSTINAFSTQKLPHPVPAPVLSPGCTTPMPFLCANSYCCVLEIIVG